MVCIRTPVSPAKTDEPIEMLYEGRREDRGNHTLDMGGVHIGATNRPTLSERRQQSTSKIWVS